MKTKNQLLILALGSNLGQRDFFLRSAISRLSDNVGKWLANSPVYESKAVGVDASHGDYLNMIVVFSSAKSPIEILKITQSIEKEFGRETKRDLKPRTLDIDIIWYGQSIKTENLEIPHPRFLERAFVCRPLLDVFPDFFEKIANAGPADLNLQDQQTCVFDLI